MPFSTYIGNLFLSLYNQLTTESEQEYDELEWKTRKWKDVDDNDEKREEMRILFCSSLVWLFAHVTVKMKDKTLVLGWIHFGSQTCIGLILLQWYCRLYINGTLMFSSVINDYCFF